MPEDLATRVAVLHPAYQLLGVIEIADREGLDPVEVARVHFALGERLGLPALVGRILALPRDDRWQTMARAALRDDLLRRARPAHRPGAARPPTPTTRRPARIAELGGGRQPWSSPAPAATLEEICADETGRPGPALGRPARGPRAAVLDLTLGDGVRPTLANDPYPG